MTDAQRTRILAGLQAHLQEELTETHALPGDGDHHGRGFDHHGRGFDHNGRGFDHHGRGFDHNGGGAGQNGADGTASPSTGGTALTF